MAKKPDREYATNEEGKITVKKRRRSNFVPERDHGVEGGKVVLKNPKAGPDVDADENIELKNGQKVNYNDYYRKIERIDAFVKENYKQISLKVNKNTYSDVLDYIDNLKKDPSFSLVKYIMELIRKDMAGE